MLLNIIAFLRTDITMHFAQISRFKFVHYSVLHTDSTMPYDKTTTKQHKNKLESEKEKQHE